MHVNIEKNLPSHGYVLYIGIAGHSSNKRTLRHCYNEYLREQRRPKRLHIYEMLTRWQDCLYFHYAELMDEEADLLSLEATFNDAFIPPFDDRDYSATVRPTVHIVRR